MSMNWYLLYEGDSVDGMGKPNYRGRTVDYKEALEYAYECTKSPYNIGCVDVITDKSIYRLRVKKHRGKVVEV